MTRLTIDIGMGFRAAARSLRRQPVVATTVIVILALGIGATTAAFSVVRGVLVHAIPYARPAELVQVTSTHVAQGVTRALVAFPKFEAYVAQAQAFSGLVAYAPQEFTLTEGVTPVSVPGARVSAGFLATLEVAPLQGRDFTDDEQARGGPRAAIIGERLWRAQFGGADITGRTVSVNGEQLPIVGVVPARFAPPLHDAEIWLPRVYETDLLPPPQIEGGSGFLRVMGRLAPGATVESAQHDVARIVTDYRTRLGAMRDAPFDAAVMPLSEYAFGDTRGTLIFLWLAGTFVFLIACANAGNVLLARYLTRTTELDIRAAIGATRTHVMAHLLAESAILAAAGLVVGVALAFAMLAWLAPLASQVLATGQAYAIDATVLAVTAGLGALAVAITGAVPSLHATAEHRSAVVESSARGATAGRGAARWRSVFVGAQVAVSFALLAGALQQAQSLLAMQRAERGFDTAGVLSFRVAPSAAKYPSPESRLELYRQVGERVGNLPGVVGVGSSQAMPAGDDQSIAYIREADQARPREEWPQAQFRIVSPGYFAALGIDLVKGRTFSAADAKDAPPVVVVSEALARRTFGDANPLGERIFLGSFPGSREIVGVAADVRQWWIESESLPAAYIPGPQLPVRLPPAYFFVRSASAAAPLVSAIRSEVAAIDPGQSLTRVRTLQAAAAEGMAVPRLRTLLVVVFAVLGAVLAAVGLWSVMAQHLAERTREIAIRMAVGAPPGAVTASIVRSTLMMTGVGLAAGLAGSLALARVARSALAGIEAPGPFALTGAAALLLVVGSATALLLARRASRIDPARIISG